MVGEGMPFGGRDDFSNDWKFFYEIFQGLEDFSGDFPRVGRF
jgi:hypothetical protein